MAIKRKPKLGQVQTTTQDETAFDAYLNKGGSVASQKVSADQNTPKKEIKFTLSIPGGLCEQLDDLRTALPIKTSRHKWVLEAILEKFQRDSNT